MRSVGRPAGGCGETEVGGLRAFQKLWATVPGRHLLPVAGSWIGEVGNKYRTAGARLLAQAWGRVCCLAPPLSAVRGRASPRLLCAFPCFPARLSPCRSAHAALPRTAWLCRSSSGAAASWKLSCSVLHQGEAQIPARSPQSPAAALPRWVSHWVLCLRLLLSVPQ